MKRREFLKFLSGAIWPVSWPFAARAQYPGTQYPYPTSPYQAPPYQQPYPAPSQAPPNQPAAAAAPDDKSVGQVSTLNGHCTVTRGNAAAIALKVADHVFQNDALATDVNSTLGITFDDETTFSLSANTRIVVDKFVFEEGASGNAASFHVAAGTAAFVASLVAKTGDMRVSTESATLGIRGTTGVVEVPAAGGAGAPAIKLYPDADGHVGRIEVFDRQGGRLGTLTQGASAFSLRMASGRLSVVPYRIPPQEAVRDRGVLQRLNASHTVGRQIAIQRRQTRAIIRQQRNNQRPNNQRPNNLRPDNQRPGGPQNPRGGPQPFNRPLGPGSSRGCVVAETTNAGSDSRRARAKPVAGAGQGGGKG